MTRARELAALVACAAMGASGTLHAQARGQATREVRGGDAQVEAPTRVLDEVSRSRKTAELNAWLGRLIGRFQVDAKWVAGGRVDKIHGTAICSGVGDGPGVRCIIQVVHRTAGTCCPAIFRSTATSKHALS